jgi:hypothetical protein
VFDRAGDDDRRRHRQSELPPRERVDEHLLVRARTEAGERVPHVVHLPEPPHQVRHVRVVDVARRRGLVVGGESVVVEVAHVGSAQRGGRQRAQRVVVDLRRRQLRPRAEQRANLGVGAVAREVRSVVTAPRDLLEHVDLLGPLRVGDGARGGLRDSNPLGGLHRRAVDR